MSELTLTQLEKYVLAESKAEALKEVPPFSPQYYFLELLGELNKPSRSEAAIDALVENFVNNAHTSPDKKMLVRFRQCLSKVKAHMNEPEEVRKWLARFNKEFLRVSFDYPNYTRGKAAQRGPDKQQEEQVSSGLTEAQRQSMSLRGLLEEGYKDRNVLLNEMEPQLYEHLELGKLSVETERHVIERILPQTPNINAVAGVVEVLRRHRELYPTSNFVTDTMWPRLDMEKRERLLEVAEFKLNPSLLINHLVDKFGISELESAERPTKERIEGWSEVLRHFDKLPDKYTKYRSLIRLKLLDLHAQLDNYDEKMFLEYLKSPCNSCSPLLKQRSSGTDGNSQNYASVTGLAQNVDENKVVEEYLHHLLATTTKFGAYLEVFDESRLAKLACVVKLMHNIAVEKVETLLSPQELQEVHDKKVMELAKNPRQFAAGEKVRLRLLLKNIGVLNVRVFEVNTQNYLMQGLGDAYDTIDVTGLLPSEEYLFSYSQPSVVAHKETLEFASISDKQRGVFIVDLIGGELNSRAIIAKGSLTVVNDGQTGRNCLIIDEEGKVCKGRDTGVYVGNLLIACDPDTGVVSIPLNIDSSVSRVVAVHDGFACMCGVRIQDPAPQLTLNVLYNAESFVVGNEVDLVVQPRLAMNNAPVSFAKLLNASVVVSTTTSEGLKNQNIFKDLKVRDTEDVKVTFIYPPKTQTIVVELSGEVRVGGGSDSRSLRASHSIAIQDIADAVIERFYFRKSERGEVSIDVLGRNGEPVANVNVGVEIKVKFRRAPFVFNLTSDARGRVVIGHIEDLVGIVASGDFGSVNYAPPPNAATMYPAKIDVIEKEAVELPLYDSAAKVVLSKRRGSGVIESYLTSSHVHKGKDALKIDGLKEGQYVLEVGSQSIDIAVYAGQYYDLNGKNILTKTGLVPVLSSPQLLLSRVTRGKDGRLVSVDVHGKADTLRAHLLTYNFVPLEMNALRTELDLMVARGRASPRPPFLFNRKTNVYKSGKRLNDEIIYVYDRQSKPSFMGNTLEKPGMLVKRNKIGQTSETVPQVNQGTDFLAQACYNAQPQMQQHRLSAGLCKRSPPCISRSQRANPIRSIPFLANPGKIYANLQVSENKVNLPEAVLDQCSYAMLVLTDGQIAEMIELDGKDGACQLADCRLAQSKKAGYLIQHERVLSSVVKGESKTVHNIKNTEMCVIDNLGQLFDILQLLTRGDHDTLNEWSFVKSWSNLEPMEKLRKYDKYASHELNLFLYYKDREFFDNVAAVLLANKKEKQFIDYYLLNDERQLQQFYNFGSFTLLNKLELALLAQKAARSHPDFSRAIVKYFSSSAALANIPEIKKNVIFDALLSANEEKLDLPKLETSMSDEGLDMGHDRAFPQGGRMRRVASVSHPMDDEDDEDEMEVGESIGDDSLRGKRLGGGGMERMMRREKETSHLRSAQINICGDTMMLNDYELKRQAEIFMPSQGTVEYEERQYWQMRLGGSIEPFWRELVEHLTARDSCVDFLPSTFMYSAANFSECLAILTFVDLAFDKIKFGSRLHNADLVIAAPNNLLLLTKEVIEKERERLDINVLCAQRFFDPADRYVYDNEDPSLRVDKRVDQFVVNKVYGSRVVVTNCTSSDINVNITHEVPQGAIPIGAPEFLKTHAAVLLSSLQSQVFEFSFYFPAAGAAFTIYPATVAKGSRIVAIAQVDPAITVEQQKTVKNLETIGDILAMGSVDDILEYISAKNILNPNLFAFSNIYGLLKSKEFYERLLATLRSKGVYEDTVWSFSVYHGDIAAFKEYVQPKLRRGAAFGFVSYFKSEVAEVDRFAVREYYPLINKRAHALGSGKVNIINDAFKQTYMRLLNYLAEKGEPATEDWLLLANYLLAQDRFDEAIRVFGRCGGSGGEKQQEDEQATVGVQTKIQRDYLAAYIDFVTGYPHFKLAKQICEEYLVYPVLSWRNLFIEMANQLAEFEESGLIESAQDGGGQEGKGSSNTAKALKAPNFTAEMEQGRLKVVSQNVDSLKIEYFKVDVEVLFSLSPFGLNDNKSYSNVKPFAQETLSVRTGENYAVTLHHFPDNLDRQNLFIQISLNEKGYSSSQFLNHMPFGLHHHLNQEFGILKLVDPATKRPVPQLYVKCFVKYKNGAVAFYKDGYTDLRGSFDYVSLNKDEVNDVDKFSLMVVGGQHGIKVLETPPPKKIGRVEGEAKQLISKNWYNLQEKNINRPGISKYAQLR